MAFRRPSRGSEPSVMRRDALESRADRGMRAYVTSGLVPTRAKRQAWHYGFTPRRACELDGSQPTSGAKTFAHAPPVGGDLGLGSDEGRRRLRFSAGARPLRWQRSGQQVARWSPSFDGDARRKHAHGQSRRSRCIDVAGCTALGLGRSGTLLGTRSAVRTGATKQRLLGLLKVSGSRLA